MVGYIYHARMILLTNGSSQLLPTLLCHWQTTQQRHCICSLLPLPKYLSCFVRRFMFRAPARGSEIYKAVTGTEPPTPPGSLGSATSAIFSPEHAYGLEH